MVVEKTAGRFWVMIKTRREAQRIAKAVYGRVMPIYRGAGVTGYLVYCANDDKGNSCTYRKRGARVKLYDEKMGYWGSTMTWG